jgi:hypothetical protein
MTANTFLRFALLFWALAFAASFAVFALVPPTGDSFTRGLNRVMGFLGWQAVAAMLAVAVWTIGNRLERGSPGRRISRVPAALAGLLAAGIVALFTIAYLSHPTGPPAEPQTAPTVTPQTG